MGSLIAFMIVIVCTVYLFIHYFPDEDVLHKYYSIDNNMVYARMDIQPYTDLGVISIHTDEGLWRVKDTCHNDVHYTAKNIPWRKHRELGKHLRHSEHPNCEVYKSSPMSFGLRTIKPIKVGDEITTDYYPLHSFYGMNV